MSQTKNNKGVYENSLNDWAEREMQANEFISVLSKLFYEKSIELVFYRSQLIDRSASIILYRHSYAENIIDRPLKVIESLNLAKAILHANVGPSKLDIGRLNREWVEENKNFVDYEDFIKIKLKHLIGKKAPYDRPADVILYGFGRIGRLLARELIILGNGKQLRLRAIVTRTMMRGRLPKGLLCSGMIQFMARSEVWLLTTLASKRFTLTAMKC